MPSPTLAPENGALRIDLRGELAGILRLASGSRKPVSERDGLEQVKWLRGEDLNL
jgi:hypothetical protein